MTQHIESPIPLSEIESVLEWVDSFKLSRATKKINRDFADAVLLAEILSVHYPKIVEMHNYPPRNSHSLKLNNWMTLNRKVLKKLKLGLCCNTMEQLANSTPGVIERVLVMVRDKIRRDEDANKSMKDEGANASSGGSYYETCGDDDHILVVPIKARINGVLETVQQKVVSYESYNALKVELKDAVDAAEVLKQKVEHLDNLIKLKDERIEELQNQLERKQARKKEVEAQQNTLNIPYDTIATSPLASHEFCVIPAVRTSSLKTVSSNLRIDGSKTKIDETNVKSDDSKANLLLIDSKSSLNKTDQSLINLTKSISKPSLTDVYGVHNIDIDKVKINGPKLSEKSEVMPEIELIEEKIENNPDFEEFKDSEQDNLFEETIHKEMKDLMKSNEIIMKNEIMINEFVQNLNANSMN